MTMEGKRIMLVGLLAMVGLVVIIAFFLMGRGGPYVAPNTTTTSATGSTTIYVPTTLPYNYVQPQNATTTIPADASSAWVRLNADLNLFRNVTPITLEYNATGPYPLFLNGSQTTVYRQGGSYSFDTVRVIQGLEVPVRVYGGFGTVPICSNLPLALFNSTLSCTTGAVSFPDPVSLLTLNASAYSNVTYNGQSSFDGDACDSFTASVSFQEALRLDNISSSGPFSADMCINTQYGYPDYYRLNEPSKQVTYAFNGTFLGIQDTAVLQPPSNFSIQSAACSPNSIGVTFTPFSNMTDPTFTLAVSQVNSTAMSLQTELGYEQLLLTHRLMTNATLFNEAINNDSFISQYFQQQLSNITYDGYNLWAAYLMFNSTNGTTVSLYENASMNFTQAGQYAAMRTYTIALPINNMYPLGGFTLCADNSCQEVYNCTFQSD